ncbi:hypothetical protein [Salinarimonas soli]|uniref:Lectin-like protein BA14k n=1 Tax=Salinarimonas soli TaxID=1638099 RepID=A0A5B2VBB1_9HYPH|nr:hypothetical protein [Salinarimonas soli]KAA2235702.1 hypothetical protein F0L46_17895 [Salinarimonas soli]
MRIAMLAAAALGLTAGAALATPLAGDRGLGGTPPAQTVHHKPGHEGGPPWTRGRSGYERGYEEERYIERRPRVTRCVTRYRERYDAYRGVYVRRPVEVCSTDGYR